MKTLPVSKVRKSLATLVESVSADKNVVVIVRYGRPAAALVPIERLARPERERLSTRRVP